jgi:hypothetical protein
MTRKLTRLQTLLAGGAFALAGIGGTTAALAHDSTPATTPAAESGVPAAVSVQTNPVAAPAAPTSAAPTSAAPSDAELHPMPVTAAQKTFTPDHDQLVNAKAIVDTANELNLPPRAQVIAVATSLQEANLHNIGDLGARNDHDSLGLFQQRPSTGGWGTAQQIQDPHHASTKFLQRLQTVDGWQEMPLTKAAQKVQVSAYPEHYAKHEQQAGDIIEALSHEGPYADLAADIS